MTQGPGTPGTTSVHGGGWFDEETGALATPVYRTSTFRFATTDDLLEGARGDRPGFYTRHGNPNFVAVERKFAALHHAEAAVVFSSGMAAFAGIVQAHLRTGDRVVAVADLYGGTRVLLRTMEERLGIATTLVPVSALAGTGAGDDKPVIDALRGARLFVAESPTNPVLRVLDLPRLAAHAHAAGAIVAFDNTFATPIGQQPLSMGADLVWESATKALGGHSDLVAGFVTGRRGLVDPVRKARQVWGSIADPESAWLLERGMKTLAVRVERQCRTAAEIAAWLAKHPAVGRVFYPGLDSHPDHETARRLVETGAAFATAGYGAMVTFACRGGLEAARRLADRVRLVANAPSLGGVESLLSLPVYTSHAYLSPAEREACGVTDDLIRLSVGLEDPADLIADLDQALGARP